MIDSGLVVTYHEASSHLSGHRYHMEAENFNFGEGKLFRIPHPHVLHGRTRRAISHAKMPRSGAEMLQSSAEGQFRGASGNGKRKSESWNGKLERKTETE